MRSVCAVLSLIGALLLALPAFADGKRDLEDGIAFYENLDTDRALERLGSAAKASDLPPKDRARAYLYLGMVHFENGSRPNAEAAWKSAFDLDKNVEVPKGTSPKTIEAIESARSSSAKPSDEPGDRPRDATGTPEITKKDPLPKVTPSDNTQTAQPDLTATTTPEEPDDGGSSTWIWVAAIGAAVVGAAVVGFLVVSSGGDCEGGGGCALISFR
jgi:hypothetical protein